MRYAQKAVLSLAVVLILSACTVRLAPDHEPAIVKGLEELSTSTEIFLASVAGGTKRSDFATKRSEKYSALIGKARGVLVLIDARPEPKPALLRWLGFSKADEVSTGEDQTSEFWQDLKNLDVPTDDQIKWYIEEVTRMKSADENTDLPKEAYETFSKPIRRALKNAIVYEMALSR